MFVTLQSWPLITESCSFYQQCCFIFIFVYMFDSKVTLEHLIWQEAELTAYNRRVSVRSKTACYIRPWSACRELLRYAHQVVKMSLLTALFFKLTPDFVTSWNCSEFYAYTEIRSSDRRQTFSSMLCKRLECSCHTFGLSLRSWQSFICIVPMDCTSKS